MASHSPFLLLVDTSHSSDDTLRESQSCVELTPAPPSSAAASRLPAQGSVAVTDTLSCSALQASVLSDNPQTEGTEISFRVGLWSFFQSQTAWWGHWSILEGSLIEHFCGRFFFFFACPSGCGTTLQALSPWIWLAQGLAHNRAQYLSSMREAHTQKRTTGGF